MPQPKLLCLAAHAAPRGKARAAQIRGAAVVADAESVDSAHISAGDPLAADVAAVRRVKADAAAFRTACALRLRVSAVMA